MLGGAKLVNSPDLIAAGQLTSNIPDRPDPPSGHSSGQSSSPDHKAFPHSLFISRSADCCRHQTKQQGELQIWIYGVALYFTYPIQD